MIQELYKHYIKNPIICTDTRKIEQGCIFFALKGEKFNGNEFAKQAIIEGASLVVIDEKEFKTSDKCLLVENVLETLQELANYHRKQLDIPFIGITGTNGKTTTKELINAVLSSKYKTSATAGNFNNHIGVPLTILSIPQNCDIAIIEMGANHMKEIDFLCNIAEPNFGLITNIGTAHIEGFGSKENIIKTKNELYQFIHKNKGELFVNANDKLLINLSERIKKTTYGKENAVCEAQLISSTPFVKLKWKNNIIDSQLYGTYNFDNILAAICVGEYFEVYDQNIIAAIENYTSSNNRSEIKVIDSNTYYLDAYNANPSSMNIAIDTFVENTSTNKIMVLGDMLELGDISKDEHQKIVTKANDLKLNSIFVGNEFARISNKYGFNFVKDNNEAKQLLNDKNLSDYHILIKGSRGIQLEKIVKS